MARSDKVFCARLLAWLGDDLIKFLSKRQRSCKGAGHLADPRRSIGDLGALTFDHYVIPLNGRRRYSNQP